MSQTAVRYEPVKLHAEKSLPCPTCGKKVRRKATFEQTLNPFNTNFDGTVKSMSDIMRELRIDARHWRAQAEKCTKCKVS